MSPDVKTALGMQLAVENANPTCKRILQTLPRTATLGDMVEVCSGVGTSEEKAIYLAEAMAVALKPLVQQGKSDLTRNVLTAVNLAIIKRGAE